MEAGSQVERKLFHRLTPDPLFQLRGLSSIPASLVEEMENIPSDTQTGRQSDGIWAQSTQGHSKVVWGGWNYDQGPCSTSQPQTQREKPKTLLGHTEELPSSYPVSGGWLHFLHLRSLRPPRVQMTNPSLSELLRMLPDPGSRTGP